MPMNKEKYLYLKMNNFLDFINNLFIIKFIIYKYLNINIYY